MLARSLFTKIKRSVLMAALVLALGLSTLAPTSSAHAQDGQPPAPGASDEAARGQKLDERLSKMYQRELEWLKRQQERLDHTDEMAARVEELISKANEKGLDTSALQAAVQAYQASIIEAQSAHDAAADILAAHDGFDENGKVTDRDAAVQTVKDARKSLEEARRLLNQAGHKLRFEVRTWLEQHRPDRGGQPQP